jgi:FK506-binding protein 1
MLSDDETVEGTTTRRSAMAAILLVSLALMVVGAGVVCTTGLPQGSAVINKERLQPGAVLLPVEEALRGEDGLEDNHEPVISETRKTARCSWTTHSHQYLGGYAGGVSTSFSLEDAKSKCEELTTSVCKAVTCHYPTESCTVRASSSLNGPTVETTYVPLCGEDAWILVLQYGMTPYTPTSDASGLVSESTEGFAKLSDDDINAMSRASDNPDYDYFKFTSDPQTSTDNGIALVRVARGSFRDTAQNMGWSSISWCSSQNAVHISECADWTPNSCTRMDTQCAAEYTYDCRRWFMDYNINKKCYNPSSRDKRCLSGNNGCGSSRGDFGIRTNLKLYKLAQVLAETGGVDINVMTPGDGVHFPQKGQEVTVDYVGTLSNGVTFDSSLDRGKPLKFKLGVGEGIKCWDEGVAQMSLGEKAKLVCSSDYGYGSLGLPPGVPPNAVLTFAITLIKIG